MELNDARYFFILLPKEILRIPATSFAKKICLKLTLNAKIFSATRRKMKILKILKNMLFASFTLQRLNRLKDLTNSAIKNNCVLTLQFKLFIGTTLVRWLKNLCDKKRFSSCIEYVDTLNALNIPMDSSVYLLQAKIYREVGMKAEALAAYEKALNI